MHYQLIYKSVPMDSEHKKLSFIHKILMLMVTGKRF